MFLSLAKLFNSSGLQREDVFLVHPIQLSRWLDEAWQASGAVPDFTAGGSSQPFLGDATIVDTLDLPTPPAPTKPPPPLLLPSGVDPANIDRWSEQVGPTEAASSPGVGLLWHHLVYAYLIESTGVFEIFAEVVRRLVVGETLGPLTPAGTKWLRATEELFLRDPPLFSIAGVVSEARPYARTSRRNAYWRMFGLDLPHPIPDRWRGSGTASEWKTDTGAGVNADFRDKWTELLRQVWLGLENDSNEAGSNPTDASYVAFLCQAIKDMLNNRRRGGLLAREEFAYVTVLSWFHLTVQTVTPIVQDLKADATSPGDILSKVAQRVDMSPAARSRELFDLAEPMSTLLRAIELGQFDSAQDAAALFTGGSTLTQDMRNIINLWQSATGDRVKDRPSQVALSSPRPSPQPLRIPVPSPAPAAVGTGSNGHGSEGGGMS